MQTKNDVNTQTDSFFNPDGFFFSQPKADILYSYYEEALRCDKSDFAIFSRMFFLFNTIKYDQNIITELRLCVKIAMIYVGAFKNRPGYRKILSNANAIIERLLNILNASHDSLEMAVLRDYVRVHDLAIANTARKELEPIAEILELEDLEDVLPEKNDVGTQTTYQSEDLVENAHVFVETDLQNLEMRFVSLQRVNIADIQNTRARMHLTRQFFDLQQDMWRLVQCITHDFSAANSYSLDSYVIRGLGLSLNVQMAYIAFLDKLQNNPASGQNLRKIAKAFQLMAQLVRIFNNYYQNTSEPELSKQQMSIYTKYIQDKSLNAKEVLIYKTILECSVLTTTQKAKIDEKYQLFQQLQVKDLIEVFRSFHNLRENTEEPEVHLDSYETYLRKELNKPGNNFESLSNLYRKATARLNLIINLVFPSAGAQMTSFAYVDGKILYQNIEYINSFDLETLTESSKLKLLLILDLYYKIKMVYLDAYISVLADSDKSLVEFLQNERFASQFRKDAYRFLLLDDKNYAKDSLLKNCEDLQKSVEMSTPLINDLVLAKLHKLSLIEEQIFIEPEEITVENPPLPTKFMPVSKTKPASQKPKVDIIEDLIAEFGSMYILQAAPGWSELRARCKVLLQNADYETAWNEIDNWLYCALQDEEAETISFKRSIFEAIFYRAVIEKLRGNYHSALNILEILNNYVVPPAYKSTYYEQTTQILCEKGAIYKLQQREQEASKSYQQAYDIFGSQNKICFPSLVHFADEILKLVNFDESLQSFIEYLETLSPILIDDYSLPYLHEFYINMLYICFDKGTPSLKFSRLFAGRDNQKPLDIDSKKYINTAIKIGKLLLNTRFDERTLNNKIRLLRIVAQSAMILSCDMQDASSYQEALHFTRELEQYSSVPGVAEDIAFLKTSLEKNSTIERRMHNKMSMEAFANNVATQFAFLRADDKFLEDLKIADPEQAPDLMLEAIKIHSTLEQIRGVIVSVYPDSKSQEKSEISVIIYKLEKIFKKYHSIAADYYVENLEKGDIELAKRYLRLEKIYSIKQLDMKNNDKFNNTSGISLLSRESIYQNEIDKSKIAVERILNKHKKLKVNVSDLSSIVSPLDENLQISPMILSKAKGVAGNNMTFKGAIMQLQEKRFWVAHACLKTCIDSGNKTQTKATHFFLAKILLWVLKAMLADSVTEKMARDLFAQPNFIMLFNELKEDCRHHLNAARNCQIIDERFITEELKTLKDLGTNLTPTQARAATSGTSALGMFASSAEHPSSLFQENGVAKTKELTR